MVSRRSIARSLAAGGLAAALVFGAAPAFARVASEATTAAPTRVDAATKAALATLVITEDNVEVQRAGKDAFKPAKNKQKLREGDTVRTDATGLAEIQYTDESYTRLDVDTTFTVVSLTDDEGNRQIKGSIDSGQIWNRTNALTESESFQTEGAGATAAVVGTAYSVACSDADHCVFTAIVHDIDLTGLDGVQKLLTPLDQCDSTTGVLCGDITQIPADELPEWILQNLLQDLVERGIDDATEVLGIVVVADDGTVSFVPPQPPPLLPPPTAPASVPDSGPAATAPGAPLNAHALPGWEQATVSFDPPTSDGGSAITSYLVTASPGGATCTAVAPATTCVVTGLDNSTTYAFAVTATNAAGTGPASSSSNSVTPPVVIPFGSEFQFLAVPPATPPATGWEQPGFDDAGWGTAHGPFDDLGPSAPYCAWNGFPTGNGGFPINGTIYLRGTFTLPSGANGLQIIGTIDNSALIFLNGQQIVGSGLGGAFPGGGCVPNTINAAVPDAFVVAGENVLAVQATDAGVATYFDLELEYTAASVTLATEPEGQPEIQDLPEDPPSDDPPEG